MIDPIFENWEKKKEQLLKENKNLTHEDLIYEIGKEEELLERLEEKMNKTQKEIRNWLSFLG